MAVLPCPTLPHLPVLPRLDRFCLPLPALLGFTCCRTHISTTTPAFSPTPTLDPIFTVDTCLPTWRTCHLLYPTHPRTPTCLPSHPTAPCSDLHTFPFPLATTTTLAALHVRLDLDSACCFYCFALLSACSILAARSHIACARLSHITILCAHAFTALSSPALSHYMSLPLPLHHRRTSSAANAIMETLPVHARFPSVCIMLLALNPSPNFNNAHMHNTWILSLCLQVESSLYADSISSGILPQFERDVILNGCHFLSVNFQSFIVVGWDFFPSPPLPFTQFPTVYLHTHTHPFTMHACPTTPFTTACPSPPALPADRDRLPTHPLHYTPFAFYTHHTTHLPADLYFTVILPYYTHFLHTYRRTH